MGRNLQRYIPLNGPYYENVDENAVMDTLSALLQDVFIDESQACNKRPGSEVRDEGFGLGSSTQESYEWKQKGYLMFVQGGKIFAKKGDTADPVEVTGATLELNERVTFAYNGTHLVMANGGKMVWTADGVTATVMADANAPTKVSHVAFIDGYIVANDADTDKIWRSALDDALTWNASWFFEAESIPDTVESLHTADSKIYAFGPSTLEIWYNAGLSGATPFGRERVIERGIIAKHSVVRANNTFYWLNEERRLVLLNGAVVNSVSLPVDRAFADMTTVSDAFGSLLRVGGRYFIVYTFPTEDQTWAYDVILDRWYRWGFLKNGAIQRWPYSSITYMQAWGLHLAGSRLNDKIYKLSLASNGDAADEIQADNITGWVSHGTDNRKKCKRIRLFVKRGAVTLDSTDLTHTPKLIVQFRDNGSKKWSNEYEVDLGGIGDTEHHKDINRLGLYRTRQWRFRLTDFAPFVLVRVQEFLEAGRD